MIKTGKFLLVFLMLLLHQGLILAQNYEWIVDNTNLSEGERVVAIMDAGSIGPYSGVSLIGQVIDNNGNWGYKLPTVANFRLYVKFTGGLTYSLAQDVKTTNIKLGLRKISESKVCLVANCPFKHTAMRVLYKHIEGSVSVIMGDPNRVFIDGELLVGEPSYESEQQVTKSLEIHNGNNSYGAIIARADEANFNLYSKTLSSQPVNTETFRIGLKYGFDERNGYISFYRGASSNGGFLGFSTNGMERLQIDAIGNVGIGTSSPKAKLDVAGTIRATEIKVEANGQTADFVFDSSYNLRDLQEVEAFIRENKHLPEIPSAMEMEKTGVNLAEMNKLLLQKIEELTLYAIDKENRILELEAAGESQKAGIEEIRREESKARKALEERLAKLEQLLLNK